jgi:predicted N-acetyltransferase YhbS
LTPSETRQVFRIYTSAFLPVETKSVQTLLTMLNEDHNYKMFVARTKSKVVGFSPLFIFTKLRLGLLDYMAVTPFEQAKGIGQTLFRHTSSYFLPIGS